VNRASISFGIVVATMLLITRLRPLPKPVEFVPSARIELVSSRSAKLGGVAVVLATLALYVVFF